MAVLALAALLVPLAGTDSAAVPDGVQEGSNWIQYRIGGDAAAELEEQNVVMCSSVDDGESFGLRSMGEWTIGIESPSIEFGEHQARFELSPPAGQYRDSDARTDDRAWADGTLVLEDGGKDPMGFSVFKGSFSIPQMDAESGFSFSLEASFSCQVLM